MGKGKHPVLSFRLETLNSQEFHTTGLSLRKRTAIEAYLNDAPTNRYDRSVTALGTYRGRLLYPRQTLAPRTRRGMRTHTLNSTIPHNEVQEQLTLALGSRSTTHSGGWLGGG